MIEKYQISNIKYQIVFLLFTIYYLLFTISPAFAQSATVATSFSPATVSAPVNTDFTIEIKLSPSQNMTAQVYTINTNFETSRLELKNITYLVGQRSSNLGGDSNSNLAEINGRVSPAEIRLIGEVLDPAGFPLTAGASVSFARLTFTVKGAQQTNINTLNTSNIIVVKPDTSLQTLPLSASTMIINQPGLPTSPPTLPPSFTKFFRIAESPTAFTNFTDNTGWQSYTAHPMPHTHTLLSPLKAGDARVIHVQFQSSAGVNSQVFRKTIQFTPGPKITSLACTHSPTGIGTNITIKGENFGPQGDNGKVKVAGSEVDVTAWDETTNTITLSLGQRLEGKTQVAVTTNDNKTLIKNCTINLTTVEFETVTQCKVAGQFSASNVDVKVFERQLAGLKTPEPIQRQKITIDGSGKPQGFAPKFEKGKNYTLIMKAPGALAKKVEFKAEDGTTILDTISFPVGDIAPASAPDGKINAFDKSELIRQWSIGKDVAKTGDFNGDSRINSLDYSCMLKNFNASDETYSPIGVGTTTQVLRRHGIESSVAVLKKMF